MRFGVKLALLFVLIGLVPLVIQGMLTYLQSQQALIHSARSHVESVGVLKEDELLQWMDGNLATLKSVATRPLLIELSGQLANARWGSEEWFAYHDDLVQNHLYPNLTARGLQNYQVIDPATGRILAATTPKYEGTFSESEDFLIGLFRVLCGSATVMIASAMPDRDPGLPGERGSLGGNVLGYETHRPSS